MAFINDREFLTTMADDGVISLTSLYVFVYKCLSIVAAKQIKRILVKINVRDRIPYLILPTYTELCTN